MTEGFQHYKNYPIYASASPEHGGTRPGWNAKGVVFEPDTTRTIELKWLRSGENMSFESKEEAEEFGLLMCQAWIDGLPE